MSTDWLSLSGRPALVLGAGGLGGASAASLAAAGAQVLAVDIDEASLGALQDTGKLSGHDIWTQQADLATPSGCREAIQRAVGELGTPEVFVHAVGMNIRKPVLEMDDDAWADMLTLNLSTAYWSGQEVGRIMVGAGYGRMVFVSSVSGLLAHAKHAPYAASKGGLNQLVRVMAREWAPLGVSVNAVAPGYVETDLTKDYLEVDGVRDELTRLVPAERLGRPHEVADAVTFLASDRAGFITGQVLYVDGGRVLV